MKQLNNTDGILSNIIEHLAEQHKLMLIGYAQSLLDIYYDDRLTEEEIIDVEEAKLEVARGEYVTLEEMRKYAQ